MFREVLAIVRSAIFLVIAPGFVAGLVPWWISRWRLETPFFGILFFCLAGGMLIMLGLIASILLSDSRCRVWVRRRLSSQPVI